MTEDWRQAGFALYVHWPFCQAKCPYCDFNSHVVSQVDQTRWAAALVAEIRHYAEKTPGRLLNSIFFGGGTPSLMEGRTVDSVISAARDAWTFANDIEITLEANPTSVDASRFQDYALAGVNRVSLGVQALRDTDLRALGRLHSVAEARQAFDVARAQFDRVSFDLIYARQGQSLSDWKTELSEALAMAADHVSLYQLTIEPGTAFWSRHEAGHLRGLPNEDQAADMYEATSEICAAAGFDGYEVSNYARRGAESRHNLIYWRYGDWVGVGPGAHGRLTIDGTRFATEAVSAPKAWLDRVEASNWDSWGSALVHQDIVAERIMMGMRLQEGIDLDRLSVGDETAPRIESLVSDGLLWQSDRRIGATPRGRMLLNSVIAELLP